MIRKIGALLISIALGGCFTFKNPKDDAKDAGTDVQDTGTVGGESEAADTGTGKGADSEDTGIVDTESDTGGTASATDEGTDAETGEVPDGGTDEADGGRDTATDMDTGTGEGGDTETETETAPDTGTGEGGGDTESDTGTGGGDTETDSCDEPHECDFWGYQCGEVTDPCGAPRDCGPCDTGNECNDETHRCEPCIDDDRCGSLCEACVATHPVCSGETPAEATCACTVEDLDAGVEDSCGEGSRCVDGVCRSCVDDDACGIACEACPAAMPVCQGETPATAACECEVDTEGVDSCDPFTHCVEGDCEACVNDEACGGACQDCTQGNNRYCDTSRAGGTCVECMEDAHCRDLESGVPRLTSPVGICTPDNTCTCWVDPDECSVAENNCTWECSSQADCDEISTSLVCAQEVSGSSHFVCLRACEGDEPVPPEDGLACEERGKPNLSTELVWAPMTSCYSYFKIGDDCSSNTQCRAVGSANDGSCQTFDTEEKCTYSCWDGEALDSWCPAGYACSNSPPVGVCIPQ